MEEAVAALDLGGLAHKRVTALSGGEKQRVVLARALAQAPQVLLLDEPTSNLDINHALSALDLIRRKVRDQGLTAICVLHDLNLAAAFCHRLAVLNQGRLEAMGPAGEVLTPELIGRVFRVEARVSPDEFGGGLKLDFRLPEAK